jgi:hypothetical protein
MNIEHIHARDASQLFNGNSKPSGPPTMFNFLFPLLAFFLIGSCCAAALLILRRRRQARRNALLPVHSHLSHRRHLTITTNLDLMESSSKHTWEGKSLVDSSSSPTSPVTQIPELRITFPDEDERDGKGGRVVVVHMSDSGSVGMAPLMQETLPPYQSSDADRFHSLDLSRIGGLQEKEQGPQR